MKMSTPNASASGPKSKSLSENKVTKKSESPVNEEMQELLTKLKELVPNMPKNKKLSKLEIIQSVIDYINDLQTALEVHPHRLRHQSLSSVEASMNHAIRPVLSGEERDARVPLLPCKHLHQQQRWRS